MCIYCAFIRLCGLSSNDTIDSNYIRNKERDQIIIVIMLFLGLFVFSKAPGPKV